MWAAPEPTAGVEPAASSLRERRSGQAELRRQDLQWPPYALGRRAADLPLLSRATGVHIVHPELGTGALDVLDLLCGELAVPPCRVPLGPFNRSSGPVVHLQAAEASAHLAFDGPSRANHATDRRMPDAVRALADAGFAALVEHIQTVNPGRAFAVEW